MSFPSEQLTPLNAADCRFVLVEDDTFLRELLRDAIQLKFAPKSLHSFAACHPALAHCLHEPPNVLLTDLRLPDGDGRDLIRKLRQNGIATRVMVMTGISDGVLPAELIAMGVAGFIDKCSPVDHFERGLQRVLQGGMYFTAGTAPTPTVVYTARDDAAATVPLTEQERTIARLVASGLSSKEIGVHLDLGTRTVEKQRAKLMEKVGVRDLAGLVRWCLRNGLG